MSDKPELCRNTRPVVMNLDAIRAAIRPAVLSEDFFESCAIMEQAVGIEPFVARRFPEMAIWLAIMWQVFEIEDRAESLRHWLIIERR
jgi:hypothetical protein